MTNDCYSRQAIVKSGKKLRLGYTTGTCATVAAMAALKTLLTKQKFDAISIILPNGEKHSLPIAETISQENSATCCVIKDAGDDPDITDRLKIYAEVILTESGFCLKGGLGIGVVTAKGLKIPIGEPAINPVPRKMIEHNLAVICKELNYSGGIQLTISAPAGVELAKKTFNPRLGIVGGISILGTSGIVEPMSESALVETIKLLIDKQFNQNSDYIVITPGNYGRDFAKNTLGIDLDKAVKYSNFLGETLDYIKYKGFKKVLLIGHVGKLVKVAGGIMNTHSSVADCRMEIVAAHAGMLGCSTELINKIMACLTTDALLDLLDENPIQNLWENIGEKILFHLNNRLDRVSVEVVMFGGNNKVLFNNLENNFGGA